jgi:chromosome segregation ATPase
MVCSIVKKGLLGAALGAGTLFLVFGTAAPSYVKTAFHKGRQIVKDSVDPQFDIDRARDMIANLKPMIEKNIETLARAEYEAENLEREVIAVQANLDGEKKAMLSLRDSLKTGDFRLAGHVADTADEVKADLAHRLDHYTFTTDLLKTKQAELKAKRKIIKAAHEQLENLKTQKTTLLTKLSNIEAQLRLIEATRAKNEFHFDGSALANAKQTVSELEQKLEVLAKQAAIEGRYFEELNGTTSSPYVDPSRDVIKEVDDALGQPAHPSSSKTGDKSL